jgi:hypothetical protein
MFEIFARLLRMKWWNGRIAFLGIVLSASAASAQAVSSCPPTATLEQLPKAIDDAVSGPGNKDRSCLRDLLLPEARLIPVSASPDGQAKTAVLTADDYISRSAKRGDKAFYERQIKYSSEVYGNIAHLWSTYEIRESPDGKAIMRGINSIEAVNDGTRWRVLEISWQAESPQNPLPAQFLP